MSMDLKLTPSNLNTSVFYDRLHRVFLPNNGFSSLVDARLSQQIVTQEHLHKLSNICFEKCVNDFSSVNFTTEESTCLSLCKSQIKPILTNSRVLEEKY